MTKEKLLKKRKRDICLVVIFGILIVVFIVATILPLVFLDYGKDWVTLLAVFSFVLYIVSVGFTIEFGMRVEKDNKELSLIQKGPSEKDVEERHKDIQETKQNEQLNETEQEKKKRNLTNTTLDGLKMNRKTNIVFVTIFGIIAGVSFILFLEMLSISNGSEEETSDVVVWVGVASFLLFVPSLVFVCVWGYELSQDQKKIDLVEQKGIPIEKLPKTINRKYYDSYFYPNYESPNEQWEDMKTERQVKKENKRENRSRKSTHYNRGTHYSVFDDHDWEHDVFHDDDIRDDDIMDFMDDDY